MSAGLCFVLPLLINVFLWQIIVQAVNMGVIKWKYGVSSCHLMHIKTR